MADNRATEYGGRGGRPARDGHELTPGDAANVLRAAGLRSDTQLFDNATDVAGPVYEERYVPGPDGRGQLIRRPVLQVPVGEVPVLVDPGAEELAARYNGYGPEDVPA